MLLFSIIANIVFILENKCDTFLLIHNQATRTIPREQTCIPKHNRWFTTENTPLQILRDNDKRLTLTANRTPITQWFVKQYDKLRQSFRQPIQPRRSRGVKM